MTLIRKLFQVFLIAIVMVSTSGCAQKSSCATSQNPSECFANEPQRLFSEKHALLIHAAIANQWRKPGGYFPAGLNTEVSITVGPSGEVLEAKTTSSSGYSEIDQSGVDAVYAASPLPIPSGKEHYLHYREIRVVFVVPAR